MTQAPGDRPPGQSFEGVEPPSGQSAPSSPSGQSHIRLPGTGEAIPTENLTFAPKTKSPSPDEAIAQKIHDSLRGSDDTHSTVQHAFTVEIPTTAATFHTLQEKPLGLGERLVQPEYLSPDEQSKSLELFAGSVLADQSGSPEVTPSSPNDILAKTSLAFLQIN